MRRYYIEHRPGSLPGVYLVSPSALYFNWQDEVWRFGAGDKRYLYVDEKDTLSFSEMTEQLKQYETEFPQEIAAFLEKSRHLKMRDELEMCQDWIVFTSELPRGRPSDLQCFHSKVEAAKERERRTQTLTNPALETYACEMTVAEFASKYKPNYYMGMEIKEALEKLNKDTPT